MSAAGGRRRLALSTLVALSLTGGILALRPEEAVLGAAPRVAAPPTHGAPARVRLLAPPPDARGPRARAEAPAVRVPERTRQPAPAAAPPPDPAALVEALRHDETRFNAVAALRELERLGDAALPALEPALRSEDRQQRQLAGYLLMGLVADPSQELLRVAVEALEHDRLPVDPGWPVRGERASDSLVANAWRAGSFLCDHAREAEPLLLAALASADEQQRFFAADALARGAKGDVARLGDALDPVVTLLLAHLEDNTVRGDAVRAASALHSLGADVLPRLRRARAHADEQARCFLSYLLGHDPRDHGSGPALRAQLQRHGVDRYVSGTYCFLCLTDGLTLPKFHDDAVAVERAAPR